MIGIVVMRYDGGWCALNATSASTEDAVLADADRLGGVDSLTTTNSQTKYRSSGALHHMGAIWNF